jgi:hypothetical protein
MHPDRFYRVSDQFYAFGPILSGFGPTLCIRTDSIGFRIDSMHPNRFYRVLDRFLLYYMDFMQAISELINSANQMDGNLLWENVGGTALHAIGSSRIYIY